MRALGRAVRLAVSTVLIFGPLRTIDAAAQTASIASAGITRTFATLTVNGKSLGDALIGIAQGDILLRVTDFARSGITKFAGVRRTISGEEYVSLHSLQPEFTYTFDVKTLQLNVIAHSADLLGSQILDLSQKYPVDTRFGQARGAFLNYDISKSAGDGGGAFFESGISLQRGLLYNTASYDEATRRISRGLSQLVFDSRPKLRRTVVGDAPISTGQLGGSALLGGVVVARQFGLDPYLLTFPTPEFRGQVLLPSQADVYVNGQIVKTISLDPGEFVLEDIPTSIGYAQTQVVIRNAMGTTTQQGQGIFSAFGLLRPGLSDYAFGAGFVRGGAAGAPLYREPAILGRYAVGVSSHMTLGARLEATGNLTSAGVNLVRTFGKLAIGLAGGASKAQGFGGAAGTLQITAPSRGAIGVGASLKWQSARYANVGLSPFDERSLFDLTTNLSAVVSRTTALGVSVRQAVSSKEGASNTVSLSISQQIGRKASLFLQINRLRGQSLLGPVSERNVSLSLTRSLGENANMGIASTGTSGTSGASRSTNVSFNRSVPGAFGLAYNANLGLGNGQNLSGSVLYTTPLGGAQAFFSQFNGVSGADFSYDGAVAAVGKHIFFTRSISDAYGMVELPGLRGAAVYGNGRFEGLTNRSGFLLLPDLASEVPNEVSVSLPHNALNATISDTTARVAPSFRSAVLFPYTVQRIRSIILTVNIKRKDGALLVAQYGQLTLSSPTAPAQVSETDGGGRAYFNDLPSGAYKAVVEFRSDVCSFYLDIPPHDQAVTNLGTKTCSEV